MSDLKDKTIKGMMWSGINSFMQQTLGLLFSIVIARRLDPSDFGMVGMLTISQLLQHACKMVDWYGLLQTEKMLRISNIVLFFGLI